MKVKTAKFVNPINGSVMKLAAEMSLDQCKAILVLIAQSRDKRPADRMSAIKLYLTLTGEMPKESVDGGQTTTLRVVVDQPPVSTVTTQISTSTTTPRN